MVHAFSTGRLKEEDVAPESEALRRKLEVFIDTLQWQRGGGADGAKSLYQAHIREGEVRYVLKAEVRDAGADLLVLGTHGRSGLSRALFGSVTEQMLASMPCALLITVPNGGSE
jgi:nucleotide-binding universal stress UspA family protein